MIRKPSIRILGLAALFSAVCALAFAWGEGSVQYQQYYATHTYYCDYNGSGCMVTYWYDNYCGEEGNEECEEISYEEAYWGTCYYPTGASEGYCMQY